MNKKKLNPKEIKAKMQALDELFNMASDMESDDIDSDLKGIKKVTVASNDPEGLKEGLEKAEEMVEEPNLDKDMEEMQGEEEMSLPEASPSDMDEEDEDLKTKMKLMKSKKKQGFLF